MQNKTVTKKSNEHEGSDKFIATRVVLCQIK